MSNLQLRIISSIVLAVVVLALTYWGGLSFRLLAVVIAAAMFYEWCQMTGAADSRRHLGAASIMFAALLAAILLGYGAAVLFTLFALSVAAIALDAQVGANGQWLTAGLAYAGLSGISLALLRGADSAGLTAILFLFAVVWTTDIAAYFVGRSVGGPKLAPSISPGKTRSGAVGGAVGGVIAGVAVAAYAQAGSLVWLGFVAFYLSVVSQAGDLFESWVKRRRGVKDSGNLIPGHGGVMDRVDGLVVAAFALYLLGWLAGSADNPAQALFGK